MRLATLLAVAACSSPPAPATPTPAPAPSAPAPDPSTPPAAPKPQPGIGETCGTEDACAAGLACVKYYGIAGPRGPEFKTCEVRCDGGGTCPDGRKCTTIADGPGQVCR